MAKLKTLKDLKADDLANWYKEHEKFMEGLSSMEICNENYNCNEFVINKLKEHLKQEAITWVNDKEKFRLFPSAREFFIEFFNITESDLEEQKLKGFATPEPIGKLVELK